MTPRCPSDEQLQTLLSGRVDSAHALPLEEHLLECEACVRRTRSLQPRDPFVAALQTVGSPDLSAIESPSVIALMEQLKQHSWVETATDRDKTQPLIDHETNSVAIDVIVDLEPPVVPGELGRLGGFRVQRLLGAGGMGAVFLALEETLHRPVALKLLRRDQLWKRDAKERFLREARAMAAVRHDHVVTIYQVGEIHGVPYIAQELLSGQTLAERLRDEPRLPTADALRIGEEIAAGLTAAHQQGVLHRDIKPANVWLEAPDGRVKLLDFGLALAAFDKVQITQAGVLVGTPAYMSPEQAQGLPLDHRSDLFSLGAVLYRMVTGRLPFSGNTTMEVLRSLAVETPPPARSINADAPSDLSDLIDKLLAKDRTQRISSAEEAMTQLQAIASSRPPTAHRAYLSGFPRSLTWFLLSLLFVCLCCLLVFMPAVVNSRLQHDNDNSAGDSPDGAHPAAKPLQNAIPSPFDALDPAAISPAERYTWQPKELVAVLGSHRLRCWQSCLSAEFHSDGKRCVVAEADGFPVTLFDVESGGMLSRAPVVGSGPLCVAPTGDRVAVGSTIWLVDNDQLRPSVDLSPDIALGFTGDGLALFVGERTESDTITLRRRLVAPVTSERTTGLPACKSFAFARDGVTAAVATADDQPVAIYDFSVDPPRHRLSLPRETGCVMTNDVLLQRHHMTFDVRGRLVTIGADRRLRWWDIMPDTCRMLGEVADVPSSIPVCSPNRRSIVITGGDSVEVWDLDDTRIVRRRTIPREPRLFHNVHSVRFSHDGRRLITSSLDGSLRVWNLAGPAIREVGQSPFNVTPVPAILSPNGQQLVVLREDAHLATWQFGGTTARETIDTDTPTASIELLPLGFSPDGRWMMVRKDNSLLARPTTGARSAVSPHWDFPIPPIAAGFAPDGETVVVSTVNALWRGQWRHDRWTDFQPLAGDVRPCDRIAFSNDGHWMAARWKHGTPDSLTEFPIWKVTPEGFEKKTSLTIGLPTSPAFSPDGKIIAVGSLARSIQAVRLWQFGEDGPIGPTPLETDDCKCMSVATDGQRLAASLMRSDGTGIVVVWNLPTRQRLHEIPLPGPVRQVLFTPDSRHLLTQNANGTVYVLRLAL